MSTSLRTSTPNSPAPPTGNLVSRPRLLARLDAAPTRRLTLVVAPAGYGKTTLLREWLRPKDEGGRRKDEKVHHPEDFPSSSILHPSKIVWLSLSELDNDPAHLLAGLAAAASQPLPAGADARTPLSYALARLFAPPQSWLLVLDDYHLITNPAIHQALDALLNLPTWPVHLVLASRTQPPLAASARLRVTGDLVELDDGDLRFTLAEARALFQAHGLSPPEPDLAQAVQRTEGWPAALELLRQAAQREPTADLTTILGRLGDERPLFDYLAGQVLSDQPADVRQFLRRTALLPYLSAELCNAFLGSADAAARLDALERQHLFIARLDEGPGRRYRYHALFQEFLRRCLEQEEGAEAVRDWHRRAAACLLEHPPLDEATAAVDHLMAAGDWSAAADAIEALFGTLDWGQLALMAGWFDRLPSDVLASRPRLLFALGQLRARQYRWAESLASYAQAERLVRQADGDPTELCRIWCGQAWVHLWQGHYAQARELAQRAQSTLHTVHPIPLQQLARVYNLLAVCSEGTDLASQEEYQQRALDIFRQLGDRLGEARLLSNIASTRLDRGRPVEAIEAAQTSQRLYDELGSYDVWRALTHLGEAYLARGELDAARVPLERQLRLADMHQDPAVRAYALYLLGHVYREQGHREAARACYDEARQLGEELQEPFVLFEPRLGLTLLALAEGDRREAHRHGQAAWQLARAVGNRYQEGLALMALGLVMDQGGDVAQAETYWRDALQLFQSLDADLYQATLHLYLADLARRAGRDEEALIHLGHSLALSGQYGYDFLYTRRERGRALPLLVMALTHATTPSSLITTQKLPCHPEGAGFAPEGSRSAQTGCFGPKTGPQHDRLADTVGRLLAQIGPAAVEPLLELLASAPDDAVRERVVRLLGEIGDERAIPALSKLRQSKSLGQTVQAALERIAAAPRPPLRILALGGFQVWRGDLPIPSAAWQRRKTRLLLLYLLTQRRPTPRDEVLEALWPDLAPDAAALALNTTFSDLRRILEPYLGKSQASRYLVRDEETLAFNPATTAGPGLTSDAWYDVWAFEQAAQAGGPAIPTALELYRGDFLPEEPYADWVLRERERLRALYLNTLMAQLTAHMQAGAWREGVELARRILEREPWLEEVWRALIQCYAMLGRRSEALHAYQSCVRALREELDVGPAPETRALYERLT